MLTLDTTALEEMMRRVFRDELHTALAICDAEEAKAKGQAQPAEETQAPAPAPVPTQAPAPATPPINEEEERAKMHALCKRFISQFGREAIMDLWKKMGVTKFSEVPLERYLELASYLSDAEKTYNEIKGNATATA